MTWRGCHAGSTTARGWTYCSQEGTDTVEVEDVEIGVLVCSDHKALIEDEPDAWRVDSWPDIGRGKSGRTDDRPRLVPT